jgi:putative endonuclease
MLQRLHDGQPTQRHPLCRHDQSAGRARAFQHHNGMGSKFTSKYGVSMLVWCEHYGDINEAIAREKQLKKWERRWKLELIEAFNPDWQDLYETLNN